MEKQIIHTRWDTFIRSIQIKNEDWTPVDITNSTLTFSIKKKITDTSYILSRNFDITDAQNWKAEIRIDWTDMELELASYYYDIQWVDSNWTIITILKGVFNIVYDITN